MTTDDGLAAVGSPCWRWTAAAASRRAVAVADWAVAVPGLRQAAVGARDRAPATHRRSEEGPPAWEAAAAAECGHRHSLWNSSATSPHLLSLPAQQLPASLTCCHEQFYILTRIFYIKSYHQGGANLAGV